MIRGKSNKEIELMRIAGKRLSSIFQELGPLVKEGVTTAELDQFIYERIKALELFPECKGYHGYPASSCISINDVVVHGIPSQRDVLKSGDFVKIDVVASYKGYCADMARGFFVGEPTKESVLIDAVARDALEQAIELLRPGIRVSDISHCIQNAVEGAGYNVIREFSGHGIGRLMHEDPCIPNFGLPGRGPVVVKGMTFAVEPMITKGLVASVIDADGWTARTEDGSIAAHVEDTLLVVEGGCEVLTR